MEKQELELLDKYFRASNYLAVGQLYLLDNPLLKRPLEYSDIKKNLVGHWGTIPGQNFIYTHLNRVIKKNDLDMMYISGPGHGGNAMIAHAYMEGTYSEVYPNITEDVAGLQRLFKHFSFPGGVSSHVSPEVPGSINEGGELGYSLAHAYGATYDNPDLIVACVVGDGEAETGPLAASWHCNKFVNPKTDGIVLPILHLNGYKIANPSLFARIPEEEMLAYFRGCGFEPYYIIGEEPFEMHERMAWALDNAIEDIKKIKEKANSGDVSRPIYPMIIVQTPKGWTCPKEVDGKKIEGTFRAHQVPVIITEIEQKNVALLEEWMKSYKPEELFDSDGRLLPEIKALAPVGKSRMSANVHANGGLLLEELRRPDFRNYGVEVTVPGDFMASDMKELGAYIRDIVKMNEDKRNFRIFGPDEALSNRLNYVFEVTSRQFNAKKYDFDEYQADDGRIVDGLLSEHVCQGWLEGYLLTGRHGFYHTYEAFVRINDSMASQHAKWLKMTKELPWRRPIASLNYVLTSHIWQQDHNGYTHQNPGFLNHLVTKKSDIVRMYLPPDANCLISCFDHCIKTRNYINVIVASKHPRPQWLSMEDAVKHCTQGISRWDFISNDEGSEPDIVMACSGDTPTLETIAAVTILRKNFPELKVRVINVVDLMKLESPNKHPHGLTDEEYDLLFTKDKPIVFAFHGYPDLIHQLTYKRTNQDLHVRGYIEEGTITTPFDMRVQNNMDRFSLVIDALKYLPSLGNSGSALSGWCKDKLVEHKQYIKDFGDDLPEIKNWKLSDFLKEDVI